MNVSETAAHPDQVRGRLFRDHALSRAGKQLAGLAGQPIDHQPDPFAHGGVGARQAAATVANRPHQVDRAARAPVDRKRLDGKPPDGSSRPRAACDAPRSPAASARRASAATSVLGEARVLGGVARLVLEQDAAAAMPKLSNSRARELRLRGRGQDQPPGLPPVNTMRASGKRRASSAIAVIRSAASLSAISSRAGDTTVSSAPPSTMMPSARRAWCPRAGSAPPAAG